MVDNSQWLFILRPTSLQHFQAPLHIAPSACRISSFHVLGLTADLSHLRTLQLNPGTSSENRLNCLCAFVGENNGREEIPYGANCDAR